MRTSPPRRQVRRLDPTSGYQSIRPPRYWPRRLGFGSLVLLLVVAGWGVWREHPEGWFGHVEASATKPNSITLTQQITTLQQQNPQVSIGVAVGSIGNGGIQTYGKTTAVTAASTTKLLAATDFLHDTEDGTYSLNGPLGDSTAAWQLQELVNQSDNDSWNLFNNLVGGAQLTAYAHGLGLDSYQFDTNTITPADEAELLELLYDGRLLNPADTKLLLSYMQHTNDDSLIPAALPAGATVYHKYGELLDSTGNYLNDAAIISDGGRTFVLTIYTDRSDELDLPTREQIIHQITADVVRDET